MVISKGGAEMGRRTKKEEKEKEEKDWRMGSQEPQCGVLHP